MDVAISPVFIKTIKSTKKITVSEGGTRSGKTYAILQVIIFYWCKNYTGLTITIARKSYNVLKTTAMRDFMEIMQAAGLWDRRKWNATDHTYNLNGNLIEFVGMDNADKKRGAKRDILYLNEATEFFLEDWRQFIIRTKRKVYIDYNPSEEFHWLYDEIHPREDCDIIHSTYLDNYAFLPPEQIEEIEYYRKVDPDFWRVYGLGLRAVKSERVYTQFDYFQSWGDLNDVPAFYYGLDFGYNNPTALILCGITDKANYWEEKFYKTGLSTSEMISAVKQFTDIRNFPVYCDSARPDLIDDLCAAGVNAFPAEKAVFEGIQHVKSKKLYICASSENLIREIKFYSFKRVLEGGKEVISDEPVKINDHLVDAGRYGTYTPHKDSYSNWAVV